MDKSDHLRDFHAALASEGFEPGRIDIQGAIQQHAPKNSGAAASAAMGGPGGGTGEPDGGAGQVIELDFIGAAPAIAQALRYAARDLANAKKGSEAPYKALADVLEGLPDSGLKWLVALVVVAFTGDEEACLQRSLIPWLVQHRRQLAAILERTRELAAMEDVERAKEAAVPKVEIISNWPASWDTQSTEMVDADTVTSRGWMARVRRFIADWVVFWRKSR